MNFMVLKIWFNSQIFSIFTGYDYGPRNVHRQILSTVENLLGFLTFYFQMLCYVFSIYDFIVFRSFCLSVWFSYWSCSIFVAL